MFRIHYSLLFLTVMLAGCSASSNVKTVELSHGQVFSFMTGPASILVNSRYCPFSYDLKGYEIYRNERKVMVRLVYTERGHKLAEVPYRDGVPHGVAKMWSGHTLIGTLPFKYGKYHGYAKYYGYDGILRGRSYFRRGSGTYYEWHGPKGSGPTRSTQFINGKRQAAVDIPHASTPID